MKFFEAISLSLMLLLLVGCGADVQFAPEGLQSVEVKYATGFKIAKGEGYSVVTLSNPWDSLAPLRKYLVVDENDEIPLGVTKDYTVVRTPLERLVVYSAPDLALLQALELEESVVGVCESQFVTLDFVTKGVEGGSIVDLGGSTMPNIEKMALLNPEAVVVTPFQNMGYGAVEKLPLSIIEVASYMESHPLGQCEWIKFLALFTDRQQMADSIFSSIENQYLEAKSLTEGQSLKPSIMAGKRYGQSWHMAAGESFMANIYKDAGAYYPWSESRGQGSLTLSFEKVLEQSSDANFWFIVYYDAAGELTYNKLRKEYELYSRFAPFKNRKIYGCNTMSSSYYERSILAPHLVVKDYIKVLYPELLPDYEPQFFFPLSEQ